jgi:putative endonuclease
MFYIYIIYSTTSDKYYVGYSSDPWKRLMEHNTSLKTTFTSKHRPWVLKAIFQVSAEEAAAIRIERFIKKQKSRKLMEKLCDSNTILTGFLIQLVRVS